jgi:hypothetical protein
MIFLSHDVADPFGRAATVLAGACLGLIASAAPASETSTERAIAGIVSGLVKRRRRRRDDPRVDAGACAADPAE